MLSKIEIINSQLKEILMFDKIENIITPVCCLLGENGSGKSTLLNAINKELTFENGKLKLEFDNEKKVTLYKYSNGSMNFRNKETRMDSILQDMSLRFTYSELSEGQSNFFSVMPLLDMFSDKKNPDYIPVDNEKLNLIILDEIDSGISVNYTYIMIKKIQKIIRTREDVQFIISSNDYIYFDVFKVSLSMYTGKLITIKDFKDFVNYLEKNHKTLKDKRKQYYKKNNINLLTEFI